MKLLKESNLSRILKHMISHDCGTISAFRSTYSLEDNYRRNKKLMAMLFSVGFSVTEIAGVYIENYGEENAVEVEEQAFFVADIKNKGNLRNTLRKLGEVFFQDSILFIPKPGDESELWGTNKTSDFPGYGNKIVFNHRGMGSSGQFMSKIRNKPFIYEKYVRDCPMPEGYLGKWAMDAVAKMDWQDIDT